MGVAALLFVAIGAVPARAVSPSTSVVSLSSTGTKGNQISYGPVVSADGRWVAFASDATNLVPPTVSGTHVYLRDRQRNETRQVDLTPGGGQPNGNGFAPSISDDGRYLAFLSTATDLASSPGSVQAFLFDRTTGAIRRVSTNVAPATPYNYVNDVTLSGDGRRLAYTALDYVQPSPPARADVFLGDVTTGAVRRLGEPTPGTMANGWVLAPSLSRDGSWVAYQSAATNLVTGDSNGRSDVFAENLDTGAKQLVSVRGDGAQANDDSVEAQMDDSGCAIVFSSWATNIVGGGGAATGTKTFVRDRCQGTTEAGSITSAEAVEASGHDPQISGDGCFVAYVRGTDPSRSAMLRDRCAGQTTRIDISTAGEPANNSVSEGWVAFGGAAGRYVVFSSKATNLAGADTDAVVDVFLRDRANNATPKAAFTVTQTGNRVTVDATGSSDPDGFALTGAIGFGDGTPESAGLSASHDYTRGGTYTLSVGVTDGDGATDRVYQAVTVSDPPPASAGPGSGDGTAPPPGGAKALRLSGARLSRSSFAVVPKGGRPDATHGTTLSATLSEAASLKLTFARRVKGRRSNGRCQAGARKGSPCTIYRTAGSATREAGQGAMKLALTGRLGSKALPPGSYRLTLRATSADGRRSSTVTLGLTVLAAGRRR